MMKVRFEKLPLLPAPWKYYLPNIYRRWSGKLVYINFLWRYNIVIDLRGRKSLPELLLTPKEKKEFDKSMAKGHG